MDVHLRNIQTIFELLNVLMYKKIIKRMIIPFTFELISKYLELNFTMHSLVSY